LKLRKTARASERKSPNVAGEALPRQLWWARPNERYLFVSKFTVPARQGLHDFLGCGYSGRS
jgi:hypothetical protein